MGYLLPVREKVEKLTCPTDFCLSPSAFSFDDWNRSGLMSDILYRCVSKVRPQFPKFSEILCLINTSFFYRGGKKKNSWKIHARSDTIEIRIREVATCCRPLSQFLVVLSNRDRRSRWSVSFRPANFPIPLLSRGSWRGFTGRERERERERDGQLHPEAAAAFTIPRAALKQSGSGIRSSRRNAGSTFSPFL